jgi:hypothetical protein
MHVGSVHFERAIVSTWEDDHVPYDPATFFVEDLDVFGTRAVTGDMEPLNVCYTVIRSPTSGRQGHIFYRGVLSQDDTQAPAGRLIFVNPATALSILAGGLAAGGLDAYFGIGAEGPVRLAMINKTGTLTRILLDLQLGDIATVPTDHAWFNRSTP